eukprot:CAMPEP_0206005136 /NCGR_PEP_ID=MMETSP1464-20131121/4397_1 /ASSEMBLY_ACC=CAM_ASM_001124 /TAXON_ID=119497 /ORGANISM="Exanthemachrysis gayraliae, Strain RCC1523" /LENGTH=105 /DNA_ID=CAMNT_0053378563 /DNA_START=203 /DNA_END=517 /DNA_ORIENTATION=-
MFLALRACKVRARLRAAPSLRPAGIPGGLRTRGDRGRHIRAQLGAQRGDHRPHGRVGALAALGHDAVSNHHHEQVLEVLRDRLVQGLQRRCLARPRERACKDPHE